jgi:hypothetical protein
MLQVPLPNGDILNIPMAEAAAQAAGAARANGVHMAPQMRGMTKSHSSSSMIDVSEVIKSSGLWESFNQGAKPRTVAHPTSSSTSAASGRQVSHADGRVQT